MPVSCLFTEMDRTSADESLETRTLQLAYELSMLRMPESSNPVSEPESPSDFAPLLNPLHTIGLEENRSKKSQNMTECVPVPSSEHVAEIVGRQGCKIKALRAKTNTYIKTPVRGEEPVFVVTGRKEDVAKAKREILSAAEHFSQIRATRKSNIIGGLNGSPPGPPTNIPGQITIQVRVPYRVVGLVVGPKGATIKRIQHQTHTYIVTPSRDKEPVFEVTGMPENVESARREIEAHIALRTGNGTSINGLNGLGGLEESADLLASLYKTGLNSLFNYIESPTDPFSNMTSSTGSTGAFSSSGSCSSSSSSSGGRADLGAIWAPNDRDEGLGDSPSFDSSTALSSIWSYPSVGNGSGNNTSAPNRPSPPTSTSPADSLLSSAKCLVCHEAKVTHALVPCGHNFFCMECAKRVCEGSDAQCPVCSLPAMQAIRIYSPNP
ncbi:RNA-binding protein MEX3B [Agrilus planipennis]|uniref:RNA-binding protein MEX3B n=1 Tax=Agrilus planipennis TaxID=224129 RepID=A0A1W4X6B3_AGRPL|nr:RNA-binding protein MEX3B [Agrilus planipennis]